MKEFFYFCASLTAALSNEDVTQPAKSLRLVYLSNLAFGALLWVFTIQGGKGQGKYEMGDNKH